MRPITAYSRMIRLPSPADMLFGVLFLSLIIYHAATISVPHPYDDEAVYSVYNATGTFALWDDMFDPPYRRIMHSIYTVSLVPFSMPVYGIPQKLFGIGIWQQRVFSMAGGLLSLFILYWVLRRLGIPYMGTGGIALLGFGMAFFYVMHIARVEALLLLVQMLHLLWLLSDLRSRPAALVLGFFFALGFTFHPIVLIPLCAFATLAFFWEFHHWKNENQLVRYMWWAIGFIAGFVLYLFIVDAENSVISMKFARSVSYEGFPFLRFKWNVIGLLENATQHYNPPALHRRYYTYLCGISMGLTLVAARKFHAMKAAGKFLVAANIIFAASTALLSSSVGGWSYQIFHYPWLILAPLYILVAHIRTKSSFEPWDVFLFAGSILLFLSFQQPAPRALWPIGLLAYAIAGAIGKGGKWLRLISFPVIAVLSLLLYFSDFAVTIGYLMHSIRMKPFAGILAFVWPWIVLRSDFRLRFFGFPLKKPIIVGYAILMILFHVLNETSIIAGYFSRARQETDIDVVLADMRLGKKIIGPPELWLYVQNDQLRMFDMLLIAKPLLSERYNAIWSIERFQPDYLLWPAKNIEWLEKEAARMRRIRPTFSKGKTLRLPFGDFDQVYVHWKPPNP